MKILEKIRETAKQFSRIEEAENEIKENMQFIKETEMKFMQKEEELKTLVNDLRQDMWNQHIYKAPMPSPLVEVHITEHCNLNCRMCSHFSPLAPETYLSLEEYTSDISRLKELYQNDLFHLRILGGEPLLHPHLLQFLKETRKILDHTRIELLTNGLLLLKRGGVEDGFWDCMRENNIYLMITRYPVQADYNAIAEKAAAEKVKLRYTEDTENTVKSLHKLPLDLEGQQNIGRNFYLCFHANGCVQLSHGKLYTCPVAANARFFREYFGADMNLSEKDGIDIYKAQSAEEISRFLASPIPFCRYCRIEERSYGHEWGISKRDISEWT